MSLEAIKAISDAEEKARSVKAESAVLSKKLVAEAEENGRLSVENAKKTAEEEMREQKLKASAKAKEEALELARNTENKKATLLVKAESRVDKAVDLVIERIVNS